MNRRRLIEDNSNGSMANPYLDLSIGNRDESVANPCEEVCLSGKVMVKKQVGS